MEQNVLGFLLWEEIENTCMGTNVSGNIFKHKNLEKMFGNKIWKTKMLKQLLETISGKTKYGKQIETTIETIC